MHGIGENAILKIKSICKFDTLFFFLGFSNIIPLWALPAAEIMLNFFYNFRDFALVKNVFFARIYFSRFSRFELHSRKMHDREIFKNDFL